MNQLKIKSILVISVFIFTLSSAANSSTLEEICKKTWVYFDLGNTLVDTRDGSKKIKYMPEANEYLRTLKEAGCTLGLITNIPQKWGATYNERMDKLKAYIDSGWIDDEPFRWEDFSEVFIPFNDEERKPNTILFRVVHFNGWTRGKHVVYQGETPSEIETAMGVGMGGYVVGSHPDHFFMPLNEIK